MCLDFQKLLQIILIKNASGHIFSLGDTSISLLTEEKDTMSEKNFFFPKLVIYNNQRILTKTLGYR